MVNSKIVFQPDVNDDVFAAFILTDCAVCNEFVNIS